MTTTTGKRTRSSTAAMRQAKLPREYRARSSSTTPGVSSDDGDNTSDYFGEEREEKKPKIKREHSGGDENEGPHSNGVEHLTLPEDMGETPFAKLWEAAVEHGKTETKLDKDGVVVYWMRNKDLRLKDNRALAHASTLAKDLSIPLIVLYIFSPSDLKAHDRSPRRIDFMIRQLRLLQPILHKAHIPLYTVTWTERKEIPTKLADLLQEWNATHLFANVEHEVDELRRDIEVLNRATKARQGEGGWAGDVAFLNDFCIVPPGTIVSLKGTPYSVFSPWYNNWVNHVASNLGTYIDDEGTFAPNTDEAAKRPLVKELLKHEVPEYLEGWKLDKDDQKTMEHLWPVGVEDDVMDRFIKTKLRDQTFQHPPLHPGAEEVKLKDSKIGQYKTGRNRVDQDGTSHISPYLAAGMISPRECLRATMRVTGKLQTDKMNSGPGMWVSEVAWRDFYQHVLVAFPRVSMGRPFNQKYASVVWEDNDEHFQAWKDGKTGFPIVDAAMRALKEQGYMHNRCRMIVAMFLTKDLMIDWRKGEKWFMENLIDGDLGSNNGGWQWSASTGTDPQPYFRVFHPTSQSEKSDVSGDYIKHWVPELKKLQGKALHEPHSHFSAAELKKMGYCSPIVDHKKARLRALARFKNPGDPSDS